MEIFAKPINVKNNAVNNNFDFIDFILGAPTHKIDPEKKPGFNPVSALTIYFPPRHIVIEYPHVCYY